MTTDLDYSHDPAQIKGSLVIIHHFAALGCSQGAVGGNGYIIVDKTNSSICHTHINPSRMIAPKEHGGGIAGSGRRARWVRLVGIAILWWNIRGTGIRASKGGEATCGTPPTKAPEISPFTLNHFAKHQSIGSAVGNVKQWCSNIRGKWRSTKSYRYPTDSDGR